MKLIGGGYEENDLNEESKDLKEIERKITDGCKTITSEKLFFFSGAFS
mgnify:CR=1 FL=1